ncbi:MAG: hypothetical protein QOE90_1621 [Thermoplasmata archaeon]|jgi:hypothetical protein|nr:hypothetical protein [Thermoplasmata archaeon]
MRAVFPTLTLLLVLLAPLAAAQVPDPVATACGALGAAPQVKDKVPLCPEESPAPADPADAQHVHNETAPPAIPQDPQGLAQDAQQAAQGAAQDPPSAPSRLAGFVATLVEFVKHLIHLPGVGAAKAATAAVDVGHAMTHAASAVKAQAAKAISVVAGLFHREPAAAPKLPQARAPTLPTTKVRVPLDLQKVLHRAK